jgi:hypothetical protein
MRAKAVVVVTGGMIALLLLARYVALSRAGLPLGWMLYLGLPITASGVLFALRLINLGAGWSPRTDRPWNGIGAPARSLTGPSVAQRLQELEDLHARGAISDTEYSARRHDFISAL